MTNLRTHFLRVLLGSGAGTLLGTYLRASGVFDAWSATQLLLICGGAGVLLAYAFGALSEQLDQRIKWQRQAGWRWTAGLASQSIVTLGTTYVLLQLLTGFRLSWDLHSSLLLKLLIVLLVFVLLYTVLYFALYSYRFHDAERIEQVREAREQIDLQWSALRHQLQPHFLFNSLNTISALVHQDAERCELFIRRLTEVYEYPLKSYENPLVTLREELDFARAYGYLLNTRFGDQVRFLLDIPSSVRECKLPPLCLQLLIENAIKHNIISAEDPMTISLTADAKNLWVANTITRAPENVESFSVGLNNIKMRYRMLANEEIEVKKGSRFIVKLPLLR
ncbi:MAG: histidine kinase [Bacteroidota bacterium]